MIDIVTPMENDFLGPHVVGWEIIVQGIGRIESAMHLYCWNFNFYSLIYQITVCMSTSREGFLGLQATMSLRYYWTALVFVYLVEVVFPAEFCATCPCGHVHFRICVIWCNECTVQLPDLFLYNAECLVYVVSACYFYQFQFRSRELTSHQVVLSVKTWLFGLLALNHLFLYIEHSQNELLLWK